MIQDFNEISDGRIYGIKDLVRTAPHDCEGCHAYCEGTGLAWRREGADPAAS